MNYLSIFIIFLVSNVTYDFDDIFDDIKPTPTQDVPLIPEASNVAPAPTQNTITNVPSGNIQNKPSNGFPQQYAPSNNNTVPTAQPRAGFPMIDRSNKPSTLLQPNNTRVPANNSQTLPSNHPIPASRPVSSSTPTASLPSQSTQPRSQQPVTTTDRSSIAPAGYIPDRKLKPGHQPNQSVVIDTSRMAEQVRNFYSRWITLSVLWMCIAYYSVQAIGFKITQ